MRDLPGAAIDVLRAAAAVRDAGRLWAVSATGLRAGPHPWFDELVQLARHAMGVPIVLLVLVERHREILPGSVGLPQPWQQRRETPLTLSIGQYVVGAGAILAIADVRRDPVLHTSDAIRDLGVTAYAGAPVRGRDGHVLGAVCAIDAEPRAWTEPELAGLDRLAARCGRKLLELSAAAPPAADARAPAAALPGERPPPGHGRIRPLWTPRELPAALTLDGRPPTRAGSAEVVVTGRWSGEPATAIIRTTDEPAAVRRFRRRVEVAQAFTRTPPWVTVEEHRWHDEQMLVVSRPVGEPLQHGTDSPPAIDASDWSAAQRLGALLSVWRPSPAEARRWSVDYGAWIARHARTGHLTADDADRLDTLLRGCGADRAFAHGHLTPSDVIRLPSGRLALTGFGDAGMYVAGIDLATLALAAPDAPARLAVCRRAAEADIVEPFAVNLLLCAADVAARPPVSREPRLLARRHSVLLGARRLFAQLAA
ncbi:GAF domain-containing protein [Dactylosporangium sp. CA-233914]|uniref:GAF domain-containing protein n=1 Tax=Dactylosporangium sp. CA-233914 TaxID=3239934 RepID=UPI003D920942